ncbi:MAG: sugar phosphate isomerase/epimerase [Spirochaetaceae bacterium]|nr:MAG: sugar phosphate isomerase/epimerase [Spirochaetaceae bacterium]
MPNTERYPKVHNAAWPGVVGKEPGTDHPPIDLDTMIKLTTGAKVNGRSFDGIDLFIADPHISIDSSKDEISSVADKIGNAGLAVGTLIAPVWPPVGGGSAMGDASEQQKFLDAVKKTCQIGQWLNDIGVRKYGVVRIDSAAGVGDWAAEPGTNQDRIADTFRKAADVAEGFGEQLAAEGEICWGGMHSWRRMVELLEKVNRPKTVGFQADMAHTLLYLMGYNAPEDAILPQGYDWKDKGTLDEALKQLTAKLRPWTMDFHVAQNDATVFGSGSHDKTGRHCLPNDPNGKLDVAHHAGFWLRDESGNLTKRFRHICWDGCMFPNDVMMKQQTWNDILAALLAVQDAHGWDE